MTPTRARILAALAHGPLSLGSLLARVIDPADWAEPDPAVKELCNLIGEGLVTGPRLDRPAIVDYALTDAGRAAVLT